VAIYPGIKVGLVEAPAFIEANLPEPVPDNFLFEAVADGI
jgi:hypothetical protein